MYMQRQYFSAQFDPWLAQSSLIEMIGKFLIYCICNVILQSWKLEKKIVKPHAEQQYIYMLTIDGVHGKRP